MGAPAHGGSRGGGHRGARGLEDEQFHRRERDPFRRPHPDRDYAIVIGTPLYVEKYQNRAGHVVAGDFTSPQHYRVSLLHLVRSMWRVEPDVTFFGIEARVRPMRSAS
jgi:hypothetical protein